jgi:hypothetical protein
MGVGEIDSVDSECCSGAGGSRLMVECLEFGRALAGVSAAAGGAGVGSEVLAVSADVGDCAGEFSLAGDVAASAEGAGAPRSASPAVIGVNSVGSACGSASGVASGSGSF